MEVRDLWPDSVVAVGASAQRSALVRSLEWLARRLYRAARHVVTVTDAQRAAIVGVGIAPDRVSVVPNGVDDDFVRAGRRARQRTDRAPRAG